jgi:hypothetical protein
VCKASGQTRCFVFFVCRWRAAAGAKITSSPRTFQPQFICSGSPPGNSCGTFGFECYEGLRLNGHTGTQHRGEAQSEMTARRSLVVRDSCRADWKWRQHLEIIIIYAPIDKRYVRRRTADRSNVVDAGF